MADGRERSEVLAEDRGLLQNPVSPSPKLLFLPLKVLVAGGLFLSPSRSLCPN